MRTRFWSVVAISTFACAMVIASEKPTAEYQNLMKSNGSTAGTLRMHIMAKDYDAIANDAATLKSNLAQIETFWTQKNVSDAVTFAKTGQKAAMDLESAAKTKDEGAIAAAAMVINGACGSCHMAHRERLPDMTFEIK
jgi:cytochrome c556